MHVVASGSIQIIGVSLIRPKVFPDTFDIRVAHATDCPAPHLRFAKSPHCAANLSAFFALQIFLHEITDTAGLFLFRSRPIFILTKVALNLPTTRAGAGQIDRHLLLAFSETNFAMLS
jgi:hypothetical protein